MATENKTEKEVSCSEKEKRRKRRTKTIAEIESDRRRHFSRTAKNFEDNRKTRPQ